MKTIGIVGGAARPGSLVYHRIIAEEVARRLGIHGTPAWFRGL